MASLLNALTCAGIATTLWTVLGLPIALRVLPRSLALMAAPALGWAVQNAIALPILQFVGMSRTTVQTLALLSVLAAIAVLFASRDVQDAGNRSRAIPYWALAGAALLALAPMAAILPKFSGDGVALAPQIFDHSKIAMIDEMARVGVPPENPFFGAAGEPSRLSYYYLWHFSAAQLVLLTGLSGWEADAGLTWFTAFASLALMIGIANWLSGQASSAIWVVVLAGTASLRPIVSWLFGAQNAYEVIQGATGFGGWMFQVAWAPQHVASAMCVVLAVLLLVELARRESLLLVVVLALVVVAGFECSAWVGGVTLAIAALPIGMALLWVNEPRRRVDFALSAAVATVLVVGLAAPFVYDQVQMAAAREAGSPVGIMPYGVLGDAISAPLRAILDLPAYWFVFLPVEFPAFYPAGVAMLGAYVRDRSLSPDRRLAVLAFALLILVSLCVSWMLVSRLGDNNDLGWRAVLPAVILLIVFSAVGLARWLSAPRPLAAAAALGAVMLGLVEGTMLVYGNVVVEPQPSAKVFAATPGMWQAVRRHSGEQDRVANNPHFLRDMTPWPANISWALLSNRRSCYAARDLVGPFASLARQRLEEIDAQFARVFSGGATAEDMRALSGRYGCGLVVVTAQDAIWDRDPFAANPAYRLVETEPAAWRIYKPVAMAQR